MSGFVIENPDAVGNPGATPRLRLVSDPDGILPELIAERFGDVAALEDEQFRRPPPAPERRRRSSRDNEQESQ